ncbi:anti-repressor SinI family protein [Ornithinibacillus sp. 4-3]|uniref:Anti-repressor SinI family protein n=1 Tax=Ornithinibacillus sp. 4-3 TaxID=3231488 RepID=A0AB39HMY5_9BACI
MKLPKKQKSIIYDLGWVELIKEAKNKGLTPKEVRIFLKNSSELIRNTK